MGTNFNPDTDCLWIWNGIEYEGCDNFGWTGLPGYSNDDQSCPICERTIYALDNYESKELEAIRKILAEYESE